MGIGRGKEPIFCDEKKLLLVHYVHNHCVPLKNIMRLSEKEAYALAAQMAREHPNVTAFGRFADFANDYLARLRTEALLHESFTVLGGQTVQRHPLFFVLQGSACLYGWFGNGEIWKVPLSAVTGKNVSFICGDSMSSMAQWSVGDEE